MKNRWLRVSLRIIGLLSLALGGCGDPTSPPLITPSPSPTLVSSSPVASTVSSVAPTPTRPGTIVATTIAATASTVAATKSQATAIATVPQATSAPATTANSDSGSEDWTTYHRDNTRTGYLPNLPDPQKLSQKWEMKLDGAVYAEPLLIGSHLVVATEGNSIYSLDSQTGRIEWRTNIGKPVPLSSLPCGNIDPLGITGTPVYDPATRLIFAVAEVTGPAHQLVGVDLATGQIKVRRSADIPGMEPAPHQQRSALSLSQGMVYIAYGGLFGDCGNYHGLVIASRTDGQGNLLTFQVPTSREGGIWAASGMSIDASGQIYVAVGNGEATEGTWDHSDSVLRLSPDLKLQDGFAPKEWQRDNDQDADLGSLGPVLLSNGYIFIAGKSGMAYSLKAKSLGGVGGQVQAADICEAYGGAATIENRAFVPCNGGLQEIRVEADGKLVAGWGVDESRGSPVIGGHTVYTIDNDGKFYALDSETGNVRAMISISPTSRFATPTLSKGIAFLPTLTGVIAISLS